MRPSTVAPSHFWTLFSAIALAGVFPKPAFAESPAEKAARAEPQSDGRPDAAWHVHLQLTNSTLDEARVLAALQQELAAPVQRTQSTSVLNILVDGRSLTVQFTPEGRPAIRRQVELPLQPDRQLVTMALLVGNVVRDEAGQLLSALAPPALAAPSQVSAAAGPGGAQSASAGSTAAASTPGAASNPEATSAAVPSSAPPASAPTSASPPDDHPRAAAAAAEPLQSDVRPAETSEQGRDLEGAARPPLENAPFSLTLVSPVSLHPDLWQRRAAFSAAAFYSDIGRVEGFAVSGLGLRNRGGLAGAQVAGLWSWTGGASEGFNVGGLVAVSEGGQNGMQVGGLVSVAQGDAEGLHVGGLFSRQGGKTNGLQTGLVTSTAEDLDGMQAGLVNTADGVDGLQVGLVNVSSGPVRGAQIGLVNIGDGMKGAPIGLININPAVRVQAVAWTSLHLEQGAPSGFSAPFMGHAGVKYLAGPFYSVVALGLSRQERCVVSENSCSSGETVVAPGFGFGGRVELPKDFFVEVDGYLQWEVGGRTGRYGTNAVLARAALGYQFHPQLAVFAGGGPRLDVTPRDDSFAFSPQFMAGVQVF